MDTTKYKNLKFLKNLPKFDFGLPFISSGNLKSNDLIPSGYFKQNFTPITQSFKSEGIANAIGDIQLTLQPILRQASSIYSNAISAGEQAAAQIGKQAENS